jgi:5-methyltetrahydrofolate--homocysteine methyltransferase
MLVPMNVPKDHSYDPASLRRNTFGCNLVNPGDYENADKIRELALKGTAIAERVGSSWASRRRVTT